MLRFYFTVDLDYHPGTEIGVERLYEFTQANELKCTFFVSGMFARESSEALQEAVVRHFPIGSHGWRHCVDTRENFWDCTLQEQRDWLQQTTDAVGEAVGTAPKCFRAPKLKICEQTLGILEELGYRVDSSVPARRFDMGRGEVNSTKYLTASLRPYHLNSRYLGKAGESQILEVAPSAAVLPINMAALRIVGLPAVKWATRLVRLQSDLLVFYCHPSEFTEIDRRVQIDGESGNFTRAMGPENFGVLTSYVEFVKGMGYESRDFSDFLQ